MEISLNSKIIRVSFAELSPGTYTQEEVLEKANTILNSFWLKLWLSVKYLRWLFEWR